MGSLPTYKTACLTLALLAWTACGSNGGGIPSSTAPVQGTTVRVHNDGPAPTLSGHYTGTFKGPNGLGMATASLAEYHTSAIGGPLTVVYSTGPVAASVALAETALNVSGSIVTTSGHSYCTFSASGKYEVATHKLKGSYQAVYGCSGETGSFVLKQKCYYKGSGSEDIRPDVGGRPC